MLQIERYSDSIFTNGLSEFVGYQLDVSLSLEPPLLGYIWSLESITLVLFLRMVSLREFGI